MSDEKGLLYEVGAILCEVAQRAHDDAHACGPGPMYLPRDHESHAERIVALVVAALAQTEVATEELCECGHRRSQHVMGKHYCSKGCYTTEEQAEYFRTRVVPGFGERPTCLRFTVASQPGGAREERSPHSYSDYPGNPAYAVEFPAGAREEGPGVAEITAFNQQVAALAARPPRQEPSRLRAKAYRLAALALQSARYGEDDDFRDCVDDVLALTRYGGVPPQEEGTKQSGLYPCDGCGVMRTKAEGGTTFTVCDRCWCKHWHKTPDGFVCDKCGIDWRASPSDTSAGENADV